MIGSKQQSSKFLATNVTKKLDHYTLYRKENKELIETIDRYTDGLILTIQMQEIAATLSAAKAPKKDGKGNSYVDIVNVHMPLLEAMQTASRKAFKRAFS